MSDVRPLSCSKTNAHSYDDQAPNRQSALHSETVENDLRRVQLIGHEMVSNDVP